MQAELQRSPGDEATWKRFEELSEAERATTVDGLKQELDKLVRSDPKAALALSGVLFQAAASTPTRAGVGFRGRAVARHVNDQPEGALEDYLEAIRIYRAEGAELEVARLERALIDLYHLTGRIPEALAAAERARSTFERLGEQRQLAQLEINLGNVHFRQEELPEAGAAYAAAAKRFCALGDELGTAIAQFNRGNVEVFAGRYAEAERAYSAAATSFKAGGQWVHVAECEYAQAWMLSMRCRFSEAIGALEAAGERFREVARPSRAPLCDLDLAELYLRLDACWDANHAATRAIEAFDEVGLDYERAKALVVRGLAARRTLGAAQADLDAARTLYQRLGNERALAALDLQLQALAINAGAVTPELISTLETARAKFAASQNALLQAIATLLFARALTQAGQPERSIELLAPLTSPSAPRAGVDILLLADCLRALAEAQLAADSTPEAIKTLERAVECIEETRGSVPGTDARLAFFRDRHGAYVALARRLAEAGEVAHGLEYLELGRRQEKRRRAAPKDDPEREALDALLLKRLDAELGPLTGNADGNDEGPTDDELLKAELALTHKLRERQAGLLDEEAPQPRLSPNEAVLSFLIDEGQLGVFVQVNGETTWVPLAIGVEEVQHAAERLELALRKRHSSASSPSREARALRKIHAECDRLGAGLLGPVLGALEGASRLIVIPYGLLHGLPFHALQVAGTSLIQRFEVSQSASLKALADCRRGRQVTSAPRLMLAARDASLPAIAREAEALVLAHGGLLTELDSKELFDALAEGDLGGASLHIAAHGAFQPHNPLFSGLSLGDRVLTAHDLRALDLGLELVTLGGCETGRSGRIEGEALVGIDQAFLAAGTRAVVSSLWVVDDRTAARQMEALHKRLVAGECVGRALAEVQREDLAASPHPYDWAPFVLSGDPDARLNPPA